MMYILSNDKKFALVHNEEELVQYLTQHRRHLDLTPPTSYPCIVHSQSSSEHDGGIYWTHDFLYIGDPVLTAIHEYM